MHLDINGLPKKSHSKKLTAYASPLFKQVVVGITRLLHLNVNPDRVCFADTVCALAVVNLTYKQLEKGPRICQSANF